MADKLPQSLAAFSGRILLVVFLLASLIMMTVYSNEGEKGPLHTVQSAVSGAVLPLKIVGGAVGAGTDGVGSAIEDATANDASLESLRSYNAQLIDEIAKLEEYRQEAQRLEALLAMKDSYDYESTGARVVNRSINSWEQVITIDKGSNDGIITGLAVMGTSGVVGQVISTTSFSADVRLLGDPMSGVAVILQSSRSEGILRGSLEGLLYLEDVDADAPVEAGDMVITSGLGGSYLQGLTVGMVVKVDENQGGSTRKIVVSPNDNVGPLEEVLVVLGDNLQDEAGDE
ncbi:MAG: rod shape-determining protein MreC [Raoultibacter sp.]|jgi:rod shape-determining protein MreC